jgi:hypothetical protein
MNKTIHFLLFIILSTSITAFAQSSEVSPKTTDTDISAINIVSNNELSAELEIGGKSIRVNGQMSLNLNASGTDFYETVTQPATLEVAIQLGHRPVVPL